MIDLIAHLKGKDYNYTDGDMDVAKEILHDISSSGDVSLTKKELFTVFLIGLRVGQQEILDAMKLDVSKLKDKNPSMVLAQYTCEFLEKPLTFCGNDFVKKGE